MQAIQLQTVSRQRAGLVETQDVHIAERLDCVRLLYQDAKANDAHGSEGISDRNREEQPIWHQPRYQSRVLDRVAEIERIQDRIKDDEDFQKDDDQEHDTYDEDDLLLQRRENPAKLLCARRDLVRQT